MIGLSTLADVIDRPYELDAGAGNVSDMKAVPALLEHAGRMRYLLSYKGCDVDRLRRLIREAVATRFPARNRRAVNLIHEEWERIAPLPRPGRPGRPHEVNLRKGINAVRYLVRSGFGWQMLPIHFSAWQTVYGWFHEPAWPFLFQTIHDIELMLGRERQGQEQNPSAAVIYCQSVKVSAADQRGFDAARKIVGSQRHIVVDTDGDCSRLTSGLRHLRQCRRPGNPHGIRKRWPWVKHPRAGRRHPHAEISQFFEASSSWTRPAISFRHWGRPQV